MPQPARRTPHARRVRHLAPLLAVAAAALLAGLVMGARHEPSERTLAERYAAAWERGDYASMRGMLTAAARRRWSLERFTRAHREAAELGTVTAVRAGEPADPSDDVVRVPIRLRTRIFGTLDQVLALPMARGAGDERAVAWAPQLAFPGMRPGERLRRETSLPPRAAIEARDGTPLAEGESRLSQLGPVAAEIAGRIGPAPPERAAELRARGVPPESAVGLTGLEREFDARLTGTPGGVLRAGARVLARSRPRPGTSVRSTIDPDVQLAAVEALAGRYGGIAVVRPADGEVLGLAGVAFSAPQPPGSVFKIVTLAGALEAGVVKPGSRFPVQTETVLSGVTLDNANGEACGGTLRNAFAHSCNSVFAPMGAELGAERLVAAAERFGFNEDPVLEGAARSSIPAPAEIGDDLAVGSTAIGQGKVLTTPLHMALVASAIAEGGRRPRPTLLKGAATTSARATTPEAARFIGRAMRSVVRRGTGVGAQVPGIAVAGKTGTAELRSTVSADPAPGEPVPEEDLTDTDAWFTAFAPLKEPKVAVCVLLVGQGAGGATAAPAAKTVIEAALKN